MASEKKSNKSAEELQSVLQKLIAQGRKDGMIRAADLNAQLLDGKIDGVDQTSFHNL